MPRLYFTLGEVVGLLSPSCSWIIAFEQIGNNSASCPRERVGEGLASCKRKGGKGGSHTYSTTTFKMSYLAIASDKDVTPETIEKSPLFESDQKHHYQPSPLGSEL